MYFTYFLSALKTQKPKAVKNTKNTINEKMGKTDTPSMLDNAFLNIVLFVLNPSPTLLLRSFFTDLLILESWMGLFLFSCCLFFFDISTHTL